MRYKWMKVRDVPASTDYKGDPSLPSYPIYKVTVVLDCGFTYTFNDIRPTFMNAEDIVSLGMITKKGKEIAEREL